MRLDVDYSAVQDGGAASRRSQLGLIDQFTKQFLLFVFASQFTPVDEANKTMTLHILHSRLVIIFGYMVCFASKDNPKLKLRSTVLHAIAIPHKLSTYKDFAQTRPR